MTEAQKRARASMLRRKKQLRRRMLILIAVIAGIVLIAFMIRRIGSRQTSANENWNITDKKYIEERPELDVELLPINKYSRPGTALTEVNGVVVHYTANPGTSAMQNRDYFAGLAESHETSASSHFIIGLKGEIVQCVPCNEVAYASKERNYDTVSIECCIEDETGKFNDETYQSLVELVTWLMGRYDLRVEDVIRHYDVTGKNCPKYYVENEDAWMNFRNDLAAYIAKNGVDKKK